MSELNYECAHRVNLALPTARSIEQLEKRRFSLCMLAGFSLLFVSAHYIADQQIIINTKSIYSMLVSIL